MTDDEHGATTCLFPATRGLQVGPINVASQDSGHSLTRGLNTIEYICINDIKSPEAPMSKVITLRLPDEVYELFASRAKADNRPISNLIETAAVRHLQEHAWVEPEEMDAILADHALVSRLRKGAKDARARRGRMVG